MVRASHPFDLAGRVAAVTGAKKYVNAIPVSGTRVLAKSVIDDVPPSSRYTCPDACTVSTRIAMLKSVR